MNHHPVRIVMLFLTVLSIGRLPLQGQCQIELSSPDVTTFAALGKEVSLGDTCAFVGAPIDDAPFNSSGSVFVFHYGAQGWIQQSKLVPSDASTDALFGWCVAHQGSELVIGAVAADGVGAVYVFHRQDGLWVEAEKLSAPDAGTADRFGECVSIDGDRLVVGATFDDDLGINAGAAYVYVRVGGPGGSWAFEQKLSASDGTAGDFFGATVALDGDNLLVGAIEEVVAGQSGAGAAYLFRRSGSLWSEEQKLTASDPEFGASFGVDIALDADRALIGASQNDEAGIQAGAVYAFQFDGTQWSQAQKLLALDAAAADEFGVSVALEGDRALVGAWRDDEAFGDQGSAYLFEWNGAAWSQADKLTATQPELDDRFGRSVALRGSLALIGAVQADATALQSGTAHLHGLGTVDCDRNGQTDICEIVSGAIADVNLNLIPDGCDPGFIRGDANADGQFDVADAIVTFEVLFEGATVPCQQALDANADDRIDVADPIYEISALFRSAPLPPAPHPDCGVASPSPFSCESTPNCP